VTLGGGQTFFMRIAYSTDTPVRIWARPYFEGREVNAGSNPSHLHEGEGEALAWFFFLGEPGQQVDEIRISAGDGSNEGTHELERVRVSITAGTAPAPATAEPAWLARLKAEEERLQRETYERRMNEPLTAGDQALAAGFVLAALALGTALDPTSHNLWPFEILQASVVSLVLIGAVTFGRRVFSR
jgi:hypothetical protein